jgi:hypothetical protein
MEGLSNYRSKLEAIETLISKLENGELSVNELSDLADLTAELHERSIILKYKAFELKSNVSIATPVVEVEEEPENIVEEEPVEIDEPEEDEPAPLDFSLFEEPEEEIPEIVFETPEVEAPSIEIETEIETEKEEVIPEPIVEPIIKVEEKIEAAPVTVSAGNSFIDRIKTPTDGVGGQFAGKLDSLIGAFGLNQRLQYINYLFDGSSDAFGDAIKSLDNQEGIEAVRPKIEVLASDNEWDHEEEVVVEFVTMIKRRYA